jgi:hypothetical protein
MTELLQQVIAQIEKLPLDRQDAIDGETFVNQILERFQRDRIVSGHRNLESLFDESN